MTRSPKTAVFTSSREAEYAAMSLSSSSGGGERGRAITFREKIRIQLPGSGLPPAATVSPKSFSFFSQKLHFTHPRSCSETTTYFTVQRKTRWLCRTMHQASRPGPAPVEQRHSCLLGPHAAPARLPPQHRTSPLGGEPCLRRSPSLCGECGQRLQRPVLPAGLGHKWGSLWQPRYPEPQARVALTFSTMSSRLLKWWV